MHLKKGEKDTMIMTLGIMGIAISIIGIIKKIKNSMITFIMWSIFLISIFLGMSYLRGSLLSFIVDQIGFLLKLIWIIIINRNI